MWNRYADEKLQELARERERTASRRPTARPLDRVSPPRRRLLGPVARVAGARVRRVGEALESWATVKA